MQLLNISSGETVVRIRTDNNGTPGDIVATLNNPSSFKANALNTFTAPEGTILTGNTTYFLVVNDGRSNDRNNVRFSGTRSDDQTGVTGWSIADSLIFRVNNTAWTKSNTSLRFSVIGPAVSLIDLTVTEAGAVTEGDAPLTLTATRNETNTSGSALSIPIQIKTSGTTAQPADYTLESMSISIPNNSATGTTTFAVTDDSDMEVAKTVVIELGTLPSGNVAGSNKEVTITITDDDAPPPAKPTNLTAMEGYREIILSWANANNNLIASYQFRQKAVTGSYGGWTDIADSDATTTTHTVTGLTNGTAYTFQVRAKNGMINGAASEEVSAIPGGQTTLVSNADQSNDGASTGEIAAAEIATAFITGSSSASYTVSSVDIQALDFSSGRVVIKSTVVRIRSNNSGTPGDVVATLNNPGSVKSNALNTFTAPEGTILTGNTTYFLVVNDGRRVSINNNFQFSTTKSDEQTSPDGWSIANSGISRDGQNAAWRTNASLRFSVTGAAVNLIDLTVSEGGAVIEGDAPLTLTATRSETNTSGLALSIPIQIKTSGTTAQPADYTLRDMSISIPNNSDTGTTTLSVTDDGEVEATETIVIELGTLPAGNAAGSNKEVTIIITDNDAPPPAKPTNLTATEGYRQITLNWDDPGNSAIDDYQFRQKAGSGSYGSWTNIADSDATTATYTVTGLANGTAYTFQIRARNGMASGTASEEVSATPRAYLQTTLVSNTNQGHNFSSGIETAIAFTTGSNSPNYTISSVDIQVLNTFSGNTLVRIRSNNSGNPGDVVATLTNPGSFKSNALNTFTVPEGTNLTRNTTYFLVVNDGRGSNSNNDVQFSATNNDEQTGVTGWSIANSLILRTNNAAWRTNNASLRFAITGAAVNLIDLTVTEGGAVTEGDAPLTLTATRSETNTSGSPLSIPIQIKTSSTTAQPADYALGAMSISIPNNSATGTTTFSVTDDSDMEAAETVVIELGTLPSGSVVGSNNVAGSSKEVTITITDDDAPPPAKPTNFTATAGYRQVTLNWDDPSTSAIDDYQFRQKTGTGSYGSWTDIADSDATTTTYTVTGLTNGTAYTFQVRARNGMMEGTVSEEVSTTPRVYLQTTLVSNANQSNDGASTGEIAAAEIATAFITGSSSASYTVSSVDIQALDFSSGRLVIKSTVARIRSNNSGTPGDVVATLTNPGSLKSNALNTFTAPEGTILTGNTTYFLVVNDGRRNSLSNNFQFSTTKSDEQTSPDGWSIANSGISRVGQSIAWNTNSSLRFSITGAAVNLIDLSISKGGAVTEGDAPLTLTATRSETNTSGSALSIPIQIKTSGTTAQPADYTLGAMSISIPNNSATGTTTFSVTDDSDMEAAETVVIELGTLPSGSVVGSNNVAGSSKEVTITITDNAPEVPTGLTATAGDGQVILSWNNPGNSEITGYQFRTRTDRQFGWATITGSTAATTTHTVTGLTNAVAHAFRIRAVASGVNGAQTDEVTATPVSPDTPPVPTGLAATAGDGQVTLSWNNPNNSKITGYQFRIRTDRQFGWAAITGSTAATTTHTVTGLTNGVVHGFRIRAVAGSMNGIQSDEVTARPGNAAPTVANMIPDQTAKVGAAFSYQVPENTFNDADNDLLSYAAMRGDGTALPTWLTFNKGTRTFSGTPQAGDAGTLSVKVTADDSNGGSVFDSFDITVNARPVVTIAAGTSPVTEGTAASFTVTATPAPASNLTVNLSVAEAAGSDFVASGNEGTKTVMIPASGSVTYTVATVDDDTDEPNGSVTITVENGTGYTVGSSASAIVMVNDDDDPALATPVITIAAGNSPVDEGTDATFTVTATPAPSANLTVNLSVAEASGSDFVAADDEGTQMVTIPTSGSAMYSVATVDDDTDEPNGSVTVTVAADDTNYTVGDPAVATVVVNDNDEAPLGAEEVKKTVIFPNPSGRYLEVRSPVGSAFKILSLGGKPLLKGTTNTKVDITSLQSGLYLVQLSDGRLLKFVRE